MEWDRRIRDARGFTLIEMIMAIVLAGILGGFSIQYVQEIASMNQTVAGQKDLVDDGKLALELLLREARTAQSVTITATSITFNKVTAYPQDTNITGITYSFNAGNNTLERISGSTQVVASNVTSFSVTEPGMNFYLVSLQMNGPQGESFQIKTAVKPRGDITFS